MVAGRSLLTTENGAAVAGSLSCKREREEKREREKRERGRKGCVAI
jgi:hypothetical protein